MQPDVAAAERDDSEPARDEVAAHGEHDVDDTADLRIRLGAAEAARRENSPNAEEQMNDVVQQVDREHSEQHSGSGYWRHLHSARRDEAEDGYQEEDDTEDHCDFLDRGCHAG